MVDKGLWTKAYAQAGGDEKQTRVLYIKARFARLLAAENGRLVAIRQDQQLAELLAKENGIRMIRVSRIEKIITARESAELKELAAGRAGSDFLYYCGQGKGVLPEVKKLVETNPLFLTRTTFDEGWTGSHRCSFKRHGYDQTACGTWRRYQSARS